MFIVTIQFLAIQFFSILILTSTDKSCRITFVVRQAQLAQLVEQRTENPCVSGSIPELGILIYYGILAQVVEHLTFNQVVRGSNPRTLSTNAGFSK